MASSTLFIVDLGKRLVSGESYFLSLILFVSSLVLVYFPAVLSFILMEKSKTIEVINYVNRFSERFKNSSFLFLGNEAEKNSKKAWLTSEAQKVIEDSFLYFYDSVSTILNVLLSMVVIVIAVDSSLIWSYILSLLVIIVSIHLSNGFVVRATQSELESRNKHRQNLIKAWPNIIHGNALNFSAWHNAYFPIWKDFSSKVIQYAFVRNVMGTLTMLVALLPILGMILFLFLTSDDKNILIALVVTLPRQVQVIQMLQASVDVFLQFKSYQSKLASLDSSLDSLNDNFILNKVDFKRITLDGNPINNFENIANKLKKGEIKRSVIRGHNGVGKSVLLMYIKHRYPNAYYLPANPEGFVFNSFFDDCSTGQYIQKALKEIMSSEDKPELLLLDEWDANLDNQNKKNIDELLDQTTIPIIEVRHHF